MPAKRIQIDLKVDARKGTRDFSRATKKMKKDLKGIEKQAKASGASMIKSFKGVGVALAVVGVTTVVFKKLADGFVESIELASRLEEATGKFNVVFRNVGDAATDMRDELVDAYLMSTLEATEFLSTMQDILVPMGMARDEAANLSGEIVKLAADLGSFNNMPTAQVIDNIRSALMGETEAVRKYGVALSEARLKQKGMEMGLSGIGDELTAQEKILVRYKIIVEDTADAQGDVARTSGAFANQMKQLNANITNLKTTVGAAFLPIVRDIIRRTNEWTRANKDLITQKIEDFAKDAVEWWDEYGDSLVTASKATAEFLGNLLKLLTFLAKYGPNAYRDILNLTSAFKLLMGVLGAGREMEISREQIDKLYKKILEGTTTVAPSLKEVNEQLDELFKERKKAVIDFNLPAIHEANQKIKETQQLIHDLERSAALFGEDGLFKVPEPISLSVRLDFPAIEAAKTAFRELSAEAFRAQEAIRAGFDAPDDITTAEQQKFLQLLRDKETAEQEYLDKRRELNIQWLADNDMNLLSQVEQSKLAYDRDVRHWQEMLDQKLINQEQFNSMVKSLNLNLETSNQRLYAESTKDAKAWANTMKTIYDGIASQASSHITDLIFNWKQLKEEYGSSEKAFRAWAAQFLEDIARMIMQTIIFNTVSSMFGGTTTARQGGGPVQAGQSYMVGERGPERFVPSRSGTIVPNNMLGGGGGGNTLSVNTTVNVQGGGGVGGGTEEDQREQGRVIADLIDAKLQATLVDEQRPGGLFNQGGLI